MAYVITQNCCKDASCVPVCPVDCIRPVGGVEQFTDTEMLYIDPAACIDCGACMDECPVGAIHYEDDLPESLSRFKDINAAYFDRHPLEPDRSSPTAKHQPVSPGSLRVAIVGAGPAACYAASELIGIDGVEVNLFEKLPTPYGLIRTGVAPDHQHTKSVVDVFSRALSSPRLRALFNIEIGRDLTHDDLTAHHHAVIYAVGAAETRRLGLPGEDLPGSHAVSDFVGWYNGHPDHTDHHFDLSSKRAVIIGNGNVALDVARLLLTEPDDLAATDIAQHALEALRCSSIEEVVVLGRRGLRHAAFSLGEFMALGTIKDVGVNIDGVDDFAAGPDDDVEMSVKFEIAREYDERPDDSHTRRVTFRFLTTPVAIVGTQRAEGLRVTTDPHSSETAVIEAGLILRSIGYAGSPIADIPWDPSAGRIPHVAGRVVDTDHEPVAGVYVTGWAKRGSRGVIGTNRTCAEETVASLLCDFDSGVLDGDIAGPDALTSVLAEHNAEPISWAGWRAIDARERELGSAESRPRTKLVDVNVMVAAARSAQ